MSSLRLRGRIKQASLDPFSNVFLESIGHGSLSFKFNMSVYDSDYTAMAVDTPIHDPGASPSTLHTSSDTPTVLNQALHEANAPSESQIEERDIAASFPVDPAITSVSAGAAPIQPTHAYPAHRSAQVEEDEVPSYPPPPYVHAVRFASAAPYSTPASAGPPRSVLNHAPHRAYSTPRQASSASPGSPTRPSIRRRLFPTSPAPTRAASPGGSPAPPTDPPATPHPAPAGDPYDMDARFSAQFLAMSFYNTLLSVHDVLGDFSRRPSPLPSPRDHACCYNCRRGLVNYHRIHLPAQFAEPHSMGHLVANSVRFTVRCLNTLILECPDLYPSIPPLSPTS
ncbi:uncharacterized protein PGTG_19341 [Puccinia graminis f. sp. tritici CRL 75-36-700-3]|uniref:Uncharacterized protein n=1 Tax=Puccinia graminis f. sp. tritici (strain CRL 75-36-700-3 / race SCCL) TaxID=418459 RepID=E3LAV5_PUCGT|nr:uncharacterized protein PGTG_19341 [Puccinia graminis f. sp. tritici CRL 75-36-700-3]EFP93680.2 hypothetical protein PGTG_19341 [Puccinia graminis f. sp. tritici CRL 75-36-700-3]